MHKPKQDPERISIIMDPPVPPITISQPGSSFSSLLTGHALTDSLMNGTGPFFSPTREHVEQLAAHYAEDNPKLSD